MAQFVSKNSNYMIVLKPGIEGNRATGTHAVSGLYVKFQSGVVDVKEESVIKLLREHHGFGTDFLEVNQNEVDPYIDSREDIEPEHHIAEVKYGHVEKAAGGRPRKVKITPALKKMLETEAMKMLPGLLKKNPELLKGIILDLAKDMKAKEAQTETKTEVKEG